MTFTCNKSYPSAVKGRRYKVKAIHKVQDTTCMIVFRYVPGLTLYGRTSEYYLAIVEPDGKTATVLFDSGFTTIYDDEEGEN